MGSVISTYVWRRLGLSNAVRRGIGDLRPTLYVKQSWDSSCFVLGTQHRVESSCCQAGPLLFIVTSYPTRPPLTGLFQNVYCSSFTFSTRPRFPSGSRETRDLWRSCELMYFRRKIRLQGVISLFNYCQMKYEIYCCWKEPHTVVHNFKCGWGPRCYDRHNELPSAQLLPDVLARWRRRMAMKSYEKSTASAKHSYYLLFEQIILIGSHWLDGANWMDLKSWHGIPRLAIPELQLRTHTNFLYTSKSREVWDDSIKIDYHVFIQFRAEIIM